MAVYNTSASHVIGNLDDNSDVSLSNNPTIMNYQKALYYHIHAPAKVYPTLADAKIITASATGWTLGTIVEIIPADTITEYFDIHWVDISDLSDVDQYELVLYSGAAESEEEIGRVVLAKTSNFAQGGAVPIQVPVQSPNTRISAALASKAGSSTVDVKLYYHEYPDIA